MPLVDVIASASALHGIEVTSPISGERGVLVHLEVTEDDVSLGTIVLGDAIELHADDGKKYVVVGRRATFGFVGTRHAKPLETAPPELVPLLARSRGGKLFVIEHVVRAGDRLRLRAQVDERDSVRDDLRPVLLDESI